MSVIETQMNMNEMYEWMKCMNQMISMKIAQILQHSRHMYLEGTYFLSWQTVNNTISGLHCANITDADQDVVSKWDRFI